jgi:hypothetical protein
MFIILPQIAVAAKILSATRLLNNATARLQTARPATVVVSWADTTACPIYVTSAPTHAPPHQETPSLQTALFANTPTNAHLRTANKGISE